MTPEALTRLILQRTRHYVAIAGKGPLRVWTETGRTEHLVAALGDRVPEFLEAVRLECTAEAADVMRAVRWRTVRRMVSIGPGEGMVEAILAADLRLEALLLVDIESGGQGHGFSPRGAGYCSLPEAVLRVAMEAPGCVITTWNPTRQPPPAFPFDLCVSLYAMGFHFPRSLYAEWLGANARPGALEVYDRRGAGRYCGALGRG